MTECKAKSSLTLNITDVALYLTLTHLFNSLSSLFIIEDKENNVQKYSVLTVHITNYPSDILLVSLDEVWPTVFLRK